jgi:hypothetical protein
MPVIRKDYGHSCVRGHRCPAAGREFISPSISIRRHGPFVPFSSDDRQAILRMNSFSGEEPVRAIRPMTEKSGTFCFWGEILEKNSAAWRKEMVRPERFELPTLWFVAKCSIQLSYGRVTVLPAEIRL